LGAGAVSSIAGVRITNLDDPAEVNEQIKAGNYGFSEAECLYREKRFRETVIMGLRMIKGVSLAALQERFNMDPRQYYGNIFRKLQEDNLLEIKGDFLRIPAQSLAVANQALAELV
jgi:oxygen-independent coproporphyrinogen-3 oxidase